MVSPKVPFRIVYTAPAATRVPLFALLDARPPVKPLWDVETVTVVVPVARVGMGSGAITGRVPTAAVLMLDQRVNVGVVCTSVCVPTMSLSSSCQSRLPDEPRQRPALQVEFWTDWSSQKSLPLLSFFFFLILFLVVG